MSRLWVRLACAAILPWAAVSATAVEDLAALGVPFDASAWQSASDAQLDTLRGGFDFGGNLAISFGFVRSVSINGDLVSQIHFTLPDLSHITADQARMVSEALSHAPVVQNGPGNSAPGTVPSGGTQATTGLSSTTIVQNSLNNQLIQSKTVIDAGVNSLGILRSLNLQSTLRDALFGALGIR